MTEARALFGRRLKEARLRKGMTQAELSRLTGIAQPDVSQIERGLANCTIETMEKLAAAVDAPLHQLLKP